MGRENAKMRERERKKKRIYREVLKIYFPQRHKVHKEN
jgi:hypothetical protein